MFPHLVQILSPVLPSSVQVASFLFAVLIEYKPHAILSKASIGKVPLIRLWMKEIHCVYVDRADMKAGIEAINKMIEVIQSGYSAIIFPEGTRSKTGEIGEFKGGAFKVAQKTGAPVIPVALDGTGALFERNRSICLKFP